MSDLPLVFDGHNDVLHEIQAGGRGRGWFFEHGDQGHLDLPRARAGGFGGGLFAIWPAGDVGDLDEQVEEREGGWRIPPLPAIDRGPALAETVAAFDALLRLEQESDGAIEIVRDRAELAAALAAGRLAVVIHLEGAEPLDPDDLDPLWLLHRAGLRSLGLVWSRPNAFGHGVPFEGPASPDTGPGLTPAGLDLVGACNELGIVIDLAHLNERGFWDVAAASTAPLVASHSAAHALAPLSRNLTDAQLDAVGASGGLVGINFGVADVRADCRLDGDTPLEDIVRHVEYVAERIGIDHVALGSDFDGALVPADLGDVTGLPRLLIRLRERGIDDESLRKIAHVNWVRVLAETWEAPGRRSTTADTTKGRL